MILRCNILHAFTTLVSHSTVLWGHATGFLGVVLISCRPSLISVILRTSISRISFIIKVRFPLACWECVCRMAAIQLQTSCCRWNKGRKIYCFLPLHQQEHGDCARIVQYNPTRMLSSFPRSFQAYAAVIFSTGRSLWICASGLCDPMWWEIRPQSRDRYTPTWGEKLADGNLDEFSILRSSKLETEKFAENCLKVLQVS